MSKSAIVITGSKTLPSQAFVMAQFIAQVHALEAALGPEQHLDTPQRRAMSQIVARCPAAAIEQMSAIATQHGGAVLGLPFDPDAAREAVAFAASAAPLVLALRAAAQRLEDEALARQVAVADRVRAGLHVMERSLRTDAGKALMPEYTAMRAVLPRPSRKSAAQAAGDASTVSASPSAPPHTALRPRL